MKQQVKRFTSVGVALAALTIPVAIGSAGTPTTVKVPIEQNRECGDGFDGKSSPAGSATITRLKNGDIKMTVTSRHVPGSHVTVYPFSNTPTHCDYYESPDFFTHQPTMKLDSSGSGTITFTFTPDPGDTDIGVEVYNDKTSYSYDVSPTVHI